jgi:hypothetical protein
MDFLSALFQFHAIASYDTEWLTAEHLESRW